MQARRLPDGLVSALEGSLPELEIGPLPPAAEPAPEATPKPRKRTTRPRVEWSQERIAERIGIGYGTLTRYLKLYPEFRAILGRDGSKRRGNYGTTAEQVEAAAAWVFDQPWWTWRTMKHKACVRCQRTDSKHAGNGVCVRCQAAEAWRAKGGGHWAHPDAWDKRGGRSCCRVCLRSDKPHKGGGMCAACRWWWREYGLGRLSESAQERLFASRRAVLRRNGGRRGAGVKALKGKKRRRVSKGGGASQWK